MNESARTPNYVKAIALFEEMGLDVDVKITAIYRALGQYGRKHSVQAIQAYLGSCISYANKKIADRDLRIVPGAMKQTYRMIRLKGGDGKVNRSIDI